MTSLAAQALLEWDTRSFLRLVRLPAGFATTVLRIASRSGDGWLYPFVPLVLLLVRPEAALPFLIVGLISFAIEIPLYRLLKDRVRRPRPCEALAGVLARIRPPDEFSFPSGHTAAATIMVVLLAVFLPASAPAALLWASLVSLSRVALGVHYPSDVLAGVALGAVAVGVGFWLV